MCVCVCVYIIKSFCYTPETLQINSVKSFSHVRLCDPMDCSTPGFPVHHQLPEPTQTHVHRVGDAIQPSHPLSSPSPPTFNLSQHQGLFKWVSFSIKWPKYWSFSFNISPSNEYSELVSFRMDWLDLLAVQGTLKSLLQHHSSKVSILWCSAFFFFFFFIFKLYIIVLVLPNIKMNPPQVYMCSPSWTLLPPPTLTSIYDY